MLVGDVEAVVAEKIKHGSLFSSSLSIDPSPKAKDKNHTFCANPFGLQLLEISASF